MSSKKNIFSLKYYETSLKEEMDKQRCDRAPLELHWQDRLSAPWFGVGREAINTGLKAATDDYTEKWSAPKSPFEWNKQDH